MIRKKLRDFYLQLFKKIMDTTKYDGELPDLKFSSKPIQDVSIKERISLLKKAHDILGNSNSTPAIEYFVTIIDFFFSDFDFKYFVTFITTTLAGIFFESAIFYSLLLLEIFVSLKVEGLCNLLVPRPSFH